MDVAAIGCWCRRLHDGVAANHEAATGVWPPLLAGLFGHGHADLGVCVCIVQARERESGKILVEDGNCIVLWCVSGHIHRRSKLLAYVRTARKRLEEGGAEKEKRNANLSPLPP